MRSFRLLSAVTLAAAFACRSGIPASAFRDTQDTEPSYKAKTSQPIDRAGGEQEPGIAARGCRGVGEARPCSGSRAQKLLGDKDASVRLAAARSLCCIAPKSPEVETAVPILIELLKDNRMPIWYGEPIMLEILTQGESGRSGSYEIARRFAASNRGGCCSGKMIESQGVSSRSNEVAQDDDKWVRLTATAALGKIDPGSAVAIPGLEVALRDAQHRRGAH